MPEPEQKVEDNRVVKKALTSQSQGQSIEEMKEAEEAKLESQKTKKILKQSDSPRVIEEERRINSTLD